MFDNKALRKLILPLVLEQTLAITVGMADAMMVSSAGEAAISGVSLVDMLNNLFIGLLAAFATGGAVVTSQFIGAGKQKDACRSAKQLVYSVTGITIAMTALILVVRYPMLRLFFGAVEDDVMDACLTYLIITALSFPFLALYNSGAALFRSMGNSAITFKISVLMNIINVVGNAVGIYVFKMGVAGVAIPSLISRAVASVIITALLKNPELLIHIEKGRFVPDKFVIKKIFYIGIPSGIENAIFQLGRVIVVSVIAQFGTVQIAANGVANTLDSMGCIVGQAMNLAMITVIGQCVGARDEKQVKYYTKKLLIITYILSTALNSVILLTLNLTLKLFAISPETTALAYKLVMIHNGFAIVMWPVAFVLPNMLRACNDVTYTMVVSIASMFLFRIGLSYVLGIHFGMGAIGVWLAMVVDWTARLTAFLIRVWSGKWKSKCGLNSVAAES